jgi:hypothetical protein
VASYHRWKGAIIMQEKDNNEDKMSLEGFIKVIQMDVKKLLGKNYQVVISEVTKNNSLVLKGLVIQDKEHNLFPTIYLETYFEQYQKGKTVTELVNKIIECYNNHKVDINMDTSAFTNWENAEPRIFFKLVNYERNIKLLEEVPHEQFLDLAIVFYYIFSLENEQMATVLIRNEHMLHWNKNQSELLEVAKNNTREQLSCEITNMEDILGDLLDLEDIDSFDLKGGNVIPMYVMSNSRKVNGASCLLFKDKLRDFSEKIGTDLIILPSSVHECLLIPAFKGKEDCESFITMVREVNETQVSPDEVLSDCIYYYDREKDILELVVSEHE